MGKKSRNSLDIGTAIQRESFRIRTNTLSPLLRQRFTKLTLIERVFYMTVAFTVLVLMVSIVFIRMRTLEITNSTNNMRIEMTNTQTQIEQYNQSVKDLSSTGKVGNAAAKAGLSNNAENILKATK
ncbi:MAG: hypothetical protein ACK5LM_03895 [Lactovum sp.]